MRELHQWTLKEKLIHWSKDFEHCTVPDLEGRPVSSSIHGTCIELCDTEIQQELRSLHLAYNQELHKVSERAYRIIKWSPVDPDLAAEKYRTAEVTQRWKRAK